MILNKVLANLCDQVEVFTLENSIKTLEMGLVICNEVMDLIMRGIE